MGGASDKFEPPEPAEKAYWMHQRDRSMRSQPSQQQGLAFDDNMNFIDHSDTMPQLEGFSPQVFQQNMNAYLPTRDWQQEESEFSKYLNVDLSDDEPEYL
jgi:hypothetical protein